jgi:serine/threonine protein kinase/Tol biopolymer transport system component
MDWSAPAITAYNRVGSARSGVQRMPVNVGDRFGHYDVIAVLGEGGMGRVYRATDTKLRRAVALKILPEAFVDDPDRLARFEREAHVLASLNHPYIAAIYGLEEGAAQSGRHERALVLELVEGPTLADRIAQGPIRVDEALPIARQIAEALEAAHEAGVIHRDLKPANIKVRPDGTVKVLDFGLAKALAPDPSSTAAGRISQSPTITSPALTRAGVILGTAAYMSPEQARGDVADRRSDIWAFGCVLFEVLSGRRAFDGESVSDTLAAVLRAEPEWHRLPSNLHPRIRLLLERCLEKSVRNRYQGIGDARVDVQQVLADPHGGLLTHAPDARSITPRRLLPWLAATALLTAVIAGIGVWTLRPSVPRLEGRLTHVLPDGQSFTQLRHPLIAVAPDGSSIVYVANGSLFLRPIDELEARPIRGTEGAVSTPFFSPDGRSVGYWDSGDEGLKRIDIGGGTPVVLTRAGIVRGASWAPDGTILYGKDDGIWTVPAEGGQPKLVIPIEQGRVHGPQMLPGGRSVLFTRLLAQKNSSWDGAELVVRDLESGQEKVLMTGEDGRYVPTGHVVYALDTTLFAVPFDAAAGRVSGAAVPVVEGVRREVTVAGNTATANYGFTDDGMLVYVPGPAERLPVVPRDLVMVDREGVTRPITNERRDYWRPRISPDGTQVAVEVWDGRAWHIWVVSLATGVSTQVTFAGEENAFPVWTRDGKSIIFRAVLEGTMNIYRKPVDGSGEAQSLGVAGQSVPTDVSRDGSLVFSMGDQTAERAIWTLALNDRKALEILATPAQEHHAMFSPDGHWLAYASNASGRQEIYVRPYPTVQGTERRVSEGGGAGPVWAPDGSALYYRGTTSLMVAPTPLGPGFVPGRSRTLFSAERFRFSGNASAFDIHPDGKRFIMVTMGDPPPPLPDQINVVFNWFEELKRRAPVAP